MDSGYFYRLLVSIRVRALYPASKVAKAELRFPLPADCIAYVDLVAVDPCTYRFAFGGEFFFETRPFWRTHRQNSFLHRGSRSSFGCEFSKSREF